MRRKKIRTLPVVILSALALLLAISFGGPTAEVSFYAFDVGQGDSFLVRLPGDFNLLVDAGTKKSARSLVSKLRALGVGKIDLFVATHPHEDHIGGAVDVVGAFDVRRVWDSGYNHGSAIQRDMLQTIRGKNTRYGRPRVGFIQKAGGAAIEVLAPDKLISGTASDANNNSLVLLVTYDQVSFLMMGDIEAPGRRAAGKFPRATVLKASHHGSRNGTDDALLRSVSPEVVILSYGRGNSYGHPHKETMERIRRAGARAYATVGGDIKITTDGKTYRVEQGANNHGVEWREKILQFIR
jgi:competence protein ComEC